MIAYLDCFSGISGDMLLGALVDVGLSLDDLRTDLARLPLSGYEVAADRVTRGGICGTLVRVTTTEEHAHRRLQDILQIIGGSDLPPEVGGPAEETFRRLAVAEARVHGKEVDEIEFHEVGAVDAIVDIVGAFAGLHRLRLTDVFASALPLGGGWVETAHGRLPVPAPATAELLKGVPACGGPAEVELVTPTGAAIVTTAARSFGPIPPMTIQGVGWGAGGRDLPHPNLLRICVGESSVGVREQQLVLIETNLDNMNPEFFGHLMERLFEAGALDVFYTPIVMKKSRPATLVSVLSEPALVDRLSSILFSETTTLALRVEQVSRRCLDREWREVETEYGTVRMKIGRVGSAVMNAAPEYEDCIRVARERGIAVKLVYDAARAAFMRGQED
jgi:uncharacterized protein (TIGR00299 family) protein